MLANCPMSQLFLFFSGSGREQIEVRSVKRRPGFPDCSRTVCFDDGILRSSRCRSRSLLAYLDFRMKRGPYRYMVCEEIFSISTVMLFLLD